MKKILHPALLYLAVFLTQTFVASAKEATTSIDTDGDGISDTVEIAWRFNPQDPNDGQSDTDGDGLTLYQEVKLGTNPFDKDTDADGVSDFDEVIVGQDPLNPQKPVDELHQAEPIKKLNFTVSLPVNYIRNGSFDSPLNFTQANVEPDEDQATLAKKFPSIPGWTGIQDNLEVYRQGNNQFLKIDEGVLQKLNLNGPGSYVLTWKMRALNRGDYRTTCTGAIVYSNHFKILNTRFDLIHQGGPWKQYWLSFHATAEDIRQGIWIYLGIAEGEYINCCVDDIRLVRAGINIDANRDGSIDDGETMKEGWPFFFWINNDQDREESGGDDLPTTDLFAADCNNQVIDSTRDLIDFFPLSLNIGELIRLFPPDGQTRYTLSQQDSALNFVVTSLRPCKAGEPNQTTGIKNCGNYLNQPLEKATVQRITGEIDLPIPFLESVLNHGRSVLLFEVNKKSYAPLVFTIRRGNEVVIQLEQFLYLSEVEQMYRHLNLRNISRSYEGEPIKDWAKNEGIPTDLDPPWGLPDHLTPKKYLLFIHGFNVSAQQARGWNAEMFKRFFASGSQTKFIGVSWNGDTSPDYHEAVFRAFQVGEALPSQLPYPINDNPITIAGHSLGNVVAANAIQRGGLKPVAYLALNAAVPAEAYVTHREQRIEETQMTEWSWRKYEPRLYANQWYKLFSPTDARSQLTWKNQFSKAAAVLKNYYSPGDEVVAAADEINRAGVSHFISMYGFNFSRGAWKYQEIIKGTTPSSSMAGFIISRPQAGWEFSNEWFYTVNTGKEKYPRAYTPDEARRINTENLKTKPFFWKFREADLHHTNAAMASAKAEEKKVIYDLLARGIPSSSYALAIVSLSNGGIENYNCEMTGRKIDQWPKGSNREGYKSGRWLHSDIKNVALPVIRQTYDSMVTKGQLK